MESIDPDLDLLKRWRDGDRQAGQELFARHFADIFRFLKHKVGSEAEDLTQRTFLACVRSRHQFRAQSSFRTYLYVIARHELYAHLRRVAQRQEIDFDATSIAEIVSSPSNRLDRARQVERLRLALAALPAEQQLLLELHYWHGLEAEALAEVFGAAQGTIRVRLLRARKSLRREMADLDLVSKPAANETQDRLLASLLDLDLEPDPTAKVCR